MMMMIHYELRIKGSPESPIPARFAGPNPAGVDGFFSERKISEYDFLRKGSKSVGPVSVDLRHVKEPQTEIGASEQNLSDFSRSL